MRVTDIERKITVSVQKQTEKSRRQFFAVRQMVAVPAHQGRVAGVFKQKLQRRRFDVAVAKDHVVLASAS